MVGGIAIEAAGNARGIGVSGNLIQRTLAGGSGWGEVVLIERNQFDGSLHGVAVHNERVSTEADYTQQVRVRDNVIRNRVFATGDRPPRRG